MECFWNAMWARLGWALGELVMVVAIILAFVMALIIHGIARSAKQRRCAHERAVWTGQGQAEKRCRACQKLLN